MSAAADIKRLRSVLGLLLAFGLPAIALLGSHVRHDLTSMQAAIMLAAAPWLLLLWVTRIERRPLSSIGLHAPDLGTAAYGIAGVIVNVAISVGVGRLAATLGMQEPESEFPARLIASGYGWALVVLVSCGAFMTEIAFRGYALERLEELCGNPWLAGTTQLVLTTALFLVSRPAHALVWVVDDLVFTAFFFWRRDTAACLIAHAVPNFVASTLAALQLAH